MTLKKILIFAGTRPEAIKMAPVVYALKKHARAFNVHLCSSGQHREMLQQAFQDFDLRPDSDLAVMVRNQTLPELSARLLTAIDKLISELEPDAVLVQGDTTTVQIASLCAFYRNIRLGHVEAGLRSHSMRMPFPEELNRRITGLVANWHFTPTSLARENLLREGIAPERILTTGNTVVDALLWMVERVREECPRLPEAVEEAIAQQRRIVLITGHRRENVGEPLRQMCAALLRLSKRFPEARFVFPVHLNPRIRETVQRILGEARGILLISPLPYKPFVRLMDACSLILTDSGGIQEEGPSLGKPVLIMRDITERPEGLESGVNMLVGTRSERIEAEVGRRLLSEAGPAVVPAANPYGDGQAAQRIADFLREALSRADA